MRLFSSFALAASLTSGLGQAQVSSELIFSDANIIGVSANGTFVAGGVNGNSQPAIFSLATGLIPIGSPVAASKVSDDGATAISPEAVWTASAGIVSIPGAPDGKPIDLSADGSVVLYRKFGPGAGNPVSFWVWDRTSGATTQLQQIAGTVLMAANALSSDGSTVVGTTQFPPNIDIVTVWDTTTGAPTTIGSSAVPGSTVGYACSADGAWVTGSYVVPGLAVGAFRWSATTGLQPIPLAQQAGGVDGRGVWISTDGSQIVTNGIQSAGSFASSVWEEGAGAQSLRAWLAARGVLLAPGDLSFSDASDDFQTLATSLQDGPFNFVGFPNIWLDTGVSTSFCGPAVPNSTGASAEIGLLGSDLAGGATLVLRAVDLPPAQAVLPVTSMQSAFSPGAGGSAGNLCLGGAIGRFELGIADAIGTFELALDSDELPLPGGFVSAASGQTWFFQLWFRDPLGGSNFTDGAQVPFR